MKIKKISAQNFMSFESLDYEFPETGLYFIDGVVVGGNATNSNGSGKSSALAETLSFGLYGRTIRGSGRDEIVNWKTGKDCVVSILLEDDVGNEYTIARFRKDNVNSNDLILFKGDEDITQSKSSITQNVIDSILGMNWLTFSTVVVFGQLAARFAEAVDTEKKEILDEILMLQQYQTALANVKKDLKELSNTETELAPNISAIDAAIITLYEEDKGLDNKLAELRLKEAAIEPEIGRLQAESVSNKASLDKWYKDIEELKKETDGLRQDVKDIDQFVTQVTEDKAVAIKEAGGNVNELLVAYRTEENKVSSIEHTIGKMTDLTSAAECPTCGQDMKGSSLIEVQKHNVAELKTAKTVMEKAKKIYETAAAKEKVIEDEWSGKFDKAMGAKGDADEVLRSHIEDMNKLWIDVKDAEAKIESCKYEVEKLKAGIEPMIKGVEEDRARIKSVVKDKQTELEEVQLLLAQIQEEKKYLNFWVTGFGNQGIKSLLMDEIIPELNSRANYYIGALSDEQIKVQFMTQVELKSSKEVRDKFDLRVMKDGIVAEYNSLSGGERRRVDVGTLLALQSLLFDRVAGKCSIVVLDEIFEAMDSSGIEKVVPLLEEASKDKAIYVISHQSELAPYFRNILTVRKENGISSLEV